MVRRVGFRRDCHEGSRRPIPRSRRRDPGRRASSSNLCPASLLQRLIPGDSTPSQFEAPETQGQRLSPIFFFRPSELFPAQRPRKGKGKVPPIPGSMKSRLSSASVSYPPSSSAHSGPKNLPTKAPSPTPCSHWPKAFRRVPASRNRRALWRSTEGRSKWTSPADILAENLTPRATAPISRIPHCTMATSTAACSTPTAPGRSLPAGRDSPMLRRPETHRLPPRNASKPGKPAWSGSSLADPMPMISRPGTTTRRWTNTPPTSSVSPSSPSPTSPPRKTREWIRQSLSELGRRLESNDWSIKRADGETQAHVGFSWKSLSAGHASILLPTVLALHVGTGDEHWQGALRSLPQ